MKETIDRDVKDITRSIQKLIDDKKISGQLARDLDKLCAIAYRDDPSKQAGPAAARSDLPAVTLLLYVRDLRPKASGRVGDPGVGQWNTVFHSEALSIINRWFDQIESKIIETFNLPADS